MKKIILVLLVSLFAYNVFAQEKFDRKETAKTILNLLLKDDFNKVVSYFDTSFSRRMPAEKLEKLWKNAINQAGAYVKLKDITEDGRPNYAMIVQTIEFEKKVINFRIIFNIRNKVGSIAIAPDMPRDKYKLPAYYDSTKVVVSDVQVVSGEYKLPGTLSLPVSGNKFPAVILVHGTGPNDRDETVGSTKIFKDIALGLATKGVAVLRYDKRSKAFPVTATKLRTEGTVKEETMDDVVAAVNYLKSISSIDANRIYLFGHSFGATLLPRIAKEIPTVAGLMMFAANTGPLEDLIYDQSAYLFSLDSMTDRKKSMLDSMKVQVEKIKYLSSSSDTTHKLLLHFSKAYWLDLNNYHQVVAAKEVKQPIYILQGERDYQVPVKEFNLWKKDLSQKKNVQFKLYPKLNHLLQEGEGMSKPEEYNKQANVPLYVIDDLFNWITAQKRK